MQVLVLSEHLCTPVCCYSGAKSIGYMLVSKWQKNCGFPLEFLDPWKKSHTPRGNKWRRSRAKYGNPARLCICAFTLYFSSLPYKSGARRNSSRRSICMKQNMSLLPWIWNIRPNIKNRRTRVKTFSRVSKQTAWLFLGLSELDARVKTWRVYGKMSARTGCCYERPQMPSRDAVPPHAAPRRAFSAACE